MWASGEGARRPETSVGESVLQVSHRGQIELKGRAEIRECQEGTLGTGTQGGGKEHIEKAGEQTFPSHEGLSMHTPQPQILQQQ